MIWGFTAHIKDLDSFSDELADALYEVAPDTSLSSSCGRSRIAFDREAATLHEAIRSAIADVATVGLVVTSVELDEIELSELPR